jgi:hypothetical protein
MQIARATVNNRKLPAKDQAATDEPFPSAGRGVAASEAFPSVAVDTVTREAFLSVEADTVTDEAFPSNDEEYEPFPLYQPDATPPEPFPSLAADMAGDETFLSNEGATEYEALPLYQPGAPASEAFPLYQPEATTGEAFPSIKQIATDKVAGPAPQLNEEADREAFRAFNPDAAPEPFPSIESIAANVVDGKVFGSNEQERSAGAQPFPSIRESLSAIVSEQSVDEAIPKAPIPVIHSETIERTSLLFMSPMRPIIGTGVAPLPPPQGFTDLAAWTGAAPRPPVQVPSVFGRMSSIKPVKPALEPTAPQPDKTPPPNREDEALLPGDAGTQAGEEGAGGGQRAEAEQVGGGNRAAEDPMAWIDDTMRAMIG